MLGPEILAQPVVFHLEELKLLVCDLALRPGGGGETAIGPVQGVQEEAAGVGLAGGAGRLFEGGRFQKLRLELEVGDLGLELRQIAPGDRRFFLHNRQVVRALKDRERLLVASQFPLQLQDLLRDRTQRFSGNQLADRFLVLEELIHQRIKVGLRIGGVGARGHRHENRTFSGLRDVQFHREQSALFVPGNSVREGGLEPLLGHLADAGAAQQSHLRAQVGLQVVDEGRALGQAELLRLPQLGRRDIGGWGLQHVGDPRPERCQQGEDGHPPELAQEDQIPPQRVPRDRSAVSRRRDGAVCTIAGVRRQRR